jgi:hypothetical protein
MKLFSIKLKILHNKIIFVKCLTLTFNKSNHNLRPILLHISCNFDVLCALIKSE